MTEIIATKENATIRLDQFLANTEPNLSRSYFGKLIKGGQVLVNGKNQKSSYLVKIGDRIEYKLVEISDDKDHAPENIPLNLIYEDDNVIVIDKQAGLVVHPAVGNQQGTLVNALMHHFPQIKNTVYEPGNPISLARPGLVHRLDKDTSGVMIVAKNLQTMISLAKQIKDKEAQKKYLALCFGWPKESSGVLHNYLGRSKKDRKTYAVVDQSAGREAISHFQVKKYFETKQEQKISLVEFDIKTGRTHQIRVQAKNAGFPLIGDKVYHTKESLKASALLHAKRQMLHSQSLSILLPNKNTSSTFIAETPHDFNQITAKLIEK